MKPYSKNDNKELDTPGISGKKKKEKRSWVKEYQWKSEKDYNTYPKWAFGNSAYSEEWRKESFGSRYKSSDGVLDSIKHDLRSSFSKRFIMGRNWRARNTETGEVIEFPNIENFYQ